MVLVYTDAIRFYTTTLAQRTRGSVISLDTGELSQWYDEYE